MSKRSEIKAIVRDSLLDFIDGLISEEEIDEATDNLVDRLDRAQIIDVEEDDPDYEPDASDFEEELLGEDSSED